MAVSGENGLLRIAADFFDYANGNILFDQVADISVAERMAVTGFYFNFLAGLFDSGQTIGVRVSKDCVVVASSAFDMLLIFSVINCFKLGGYLSD